MIELSIDALITSPALPATCGNAIAPGNPETGAIERGAMRAGLIEGSTFSDSPDFAFPVCAWACSPSAAAVSWCVCAAGASCGAVIGAEMLCGVCADRPP